MDPNALTAYQHFIDHMVSVRNSSLFPERLRTGKWMFHTPPEEQKYQSLLDRLSPEDRELVAQIIQDAVDSAVFDSLKVLTENEYRIRKENLELPWEPYGSEMYYDYVERIANSKWPSKPSKP